MRQESGGILWLDAGERALAPLDEVSFRAGDVTMHGIVFTAPEQLLRPPARVEGTITDVLPRQQPDSHCGDLPGADLPPLGSAWAENGKIGIVVGLDALGRKLMVRQDDGREVEVPLTGSGDTARAPKV